MNYHPISENWELKFTSPVDGIARMIPARVPGNVLGDLFRAGLIPDPFYADNSVALRPWEFADWEYHVDFTSPPCSDTETVTLVCEGIDTVAEIRLNGQLVGRSDNMFTTGRFDLTGQLAGSGGVNTLTIKIYSSVNAARGFELDPFSTAQPYNREALPMRRARHTYGWDIAPRLIGAGLWRPVRLEIAAPERWQSVYLSTLSCSDETARLALFWSFATPRRSLEGYSGRLQLKNRDQVFEQEFPLRFVNGRLTIDMPAPRLWFPAGSGDQNLYECTLELRRDDQVLDVFRNRIGIRTIEIKRSDTLDGGGEFQFLVNGRRVFIKGSNWVPVTALHGENEPELVRRGLELASELGCNMLRCWGGGVYEDEGFFDYCDEHGILVWQDFMLACEIPPQDDTFADRMAAEAKFIIEKLRHHASLALWSGDNEGDDLFFTDDSVIRKWPPSSNRITREVLRDQVRRFDPVRDYLPSSSCIADESWRRGRHDDSPEQHLWGPRDNPKSDFYRGTRAVFASEIGYHGMPALASIRCFIPDNQLDGRNGSSPAWLCHAAQPFGDFHGNYAYRIRLMTDQVREFFGEVPESLTDFIAASQIVQAEAMKFFVESFRIAKWSKTGLIWWNIIDCWPQFSDAVVDFYGRRKLAFYYLKSVQRPLLLAFEEPSAWGIRLFALNDTTGERQGRFRVTELENGTELAAGIFNAAPEASTPLLKLRINTSRRRFLLVEWESDGETGANHYLLGAAAFDLAAYRAGLRELDRRVYAAVGKREDTW